MYSIKNLSVFAGLAFAATAPSTATALTYLYTSPLWTDSPSYHACNVANISTTNVKSVTVDILDPDGTVTSSQVIKPLVAGQSREVANSASSGFRRCRFTVDGSATKLRANITVFRQKSTDGSGVYYDVLGFESAR